MTPQIHPNWQADDGGEECADIPVHQPDHDERPADPPAPASPDPGAAHPQGSFVSRLPGAVAGIVAVSVLAVIVISSLSDLQGTLAEGMPVSITPAGFAPPSVTLAPGATIVWTNNRSLPVRVSSSDLCPPAGCLTSPAIPAGGQFSFTIDPSLPEGIYSYVLIEDPTIVGSVFVAVSETLAELEAADAGVSEDILTDLAEQLNAQRQGMTIEDSPAFVPSGVRGDIPVNPYTGDNAYTPPSETVRPPVVPPPVTEPEVRLHSGAPLPLPSTGASVLLVALSSLGGFLWSTKNHWRG